MINFHNASPISKFLPSAALSYLLHHIDSDLDVKAFEDDCGVGVVVTPEDIEIAVSFSGLMLLTGNIFLIFSATS